MPEVNNDYASSQKKKRFSWKPTSLQHLADAEDKMLSVVNCHLDKYYVTLPNNDKLWTVTANKLSKNTPLVMIHGYASGVGLWCLNYKELSENRPVYTFDVIGFGRSSRSKFPKKPLQIEEKFLESIEQWRKSEKIEKMHLLGHSFGGFLASGYTLKYPNRVKSLILADPWGFPIGEANPALNFLKWCNSLGRVLYTYTPFSSKTFSNSDRNRYIEDVVKISSPFNALFPFRLAGPWGVDLMKKLRPELATRYPELRKKDENVLVDYIYHCNVQSPTGESAFRNLSNNLGFCHHPMLARIAGLKPGIPVTFLFGTDSWISAQPGFKTKELLPNNIVSVHLLHGAKHQLYVDSKDEFHNIVKSTCNLYD